VFDVLAALEAHATERAARSLSPEDRRAVRARAAALADTEDDAALAALDLDFHAALFQPPTARLRGLIQAQRDVVRPYVLASDIVRQRRRDIEAEHARIVVALNAWDAAGAAEAARAHVHADGDALVAHVRGQRPAA